MWSLVLVSGSGLRVPAVCPTCCSWLRLDPEASWGNEAARRTWPLREPQMLQVGHINKHLYSNMWQTSLQLPPSIVALFCPLVPPGGSGSPAQVVFTVGSPPSGSTPPHTSRQRKYSGNTSEHISAAAQETHTAELYFPWRRNFIKCDGGEQKVLIFLQNNTEMNHERLKSGSKKPKWMLFWTQ